MRKVGIDPGALVEFEGELRDKVDAEEVIRNSRDGEKDEDDET